eukprot:5368000-Prymnesium_polylepis.1
MSTDTHHISDSDLSSSDSDGESHSGSPVTKKQKKGDAPESGSPVTKKQKGDAPESGSLFPSADNAVMSDEQARAIKEEKWNELCEFKNGEWYFPKGDDAMTRAKWEELTM